MWSYAQRHLSKSCDISETAIPVNDMRLQFTRLNLNENKSNEKNILSNQDIRYYQNLFPNTTCKSSSVVSDNQGPYRPCLPLNTPFDTDIDLTQYFAILNYLKDFSTCASPTKLDEHRMEQHLTTDTLTEIHIDGCWKVYDSSGQCFCCKFIRTTSYIGISNIVSVYINQ